MTKRCLCCKRRRFIDYFSRSDWKSKYPICRRCRKLYQSQVRSREIAALRKNRS